IFIRGISSIIWGKDPRRVDPFMGAEPMNVLGASVTPQQLWVIGLMLVIVLALHMFMEKTTTGKAFRACSDNVMAAKLFGISPHRMASYSFVLSAAIGAAAGMVIAPILAPAYDTGLLLGIKGFSAAI